MRLSRMFIILCAIRMTQDVGILAAWRSSDTKQKRDVHGEVEARSAYHVAKADQVAEKRQSLYLMHQDLENSTRLRVDS